MPFCEECGAATGPDRQFCEGCGAPLSAGDWPVRSSEYWLAVGIDRDETTDTAGAIESCDHALAVRPEFYEALFNRGFDLILLGRNAEAEDDFARALRIVPDIAYAMKHRALALHELGREQEGKEQMPHALELQPDLLGDL